ncbi:MAG TPA: hypothetical protein VFA49_12300, partial [Chloroflexota bacterium]|nr:hypothetical protein [Chloroflexota bacterium]
MTKYVLLGGLLAVVALVELAPAAAQSGAGTVTGRVMWGNCIRGPLPLAPGEAPDGSPEPAQPVAPDVPTAQPGVVRPIPPGGPPAGAVLVAVQNTSINTRTDETGRFTLSNVPAGVYLTVAAGPVANTIGATASQPNVFVGAGQTADLGILVLGGGVPLGFPCRILAPGTA